MSMYVIKRSGKKELMHFDKITTRNSKLCSDLSIDPIKISQKVVESLKSGMKTVEIDVLSAETALYMSCLHTTLNMRFWPRGLLCRICTSLLSHCFRVLLRN